MSWSSPVGGKGYTRKSPYWFSSFLIKFCKSHLNRWRFSYFCYMIFLNFLCIWNVVYVVYNVESIELTGKSWHEKGFNVILFSGGVILLILKHGYSCVNYGMLWLVVFMYEWLKRLWFSLMAISKTLFHCIVLYP